MQQELEKLEKFFIWKQKKLLIKLVVKWTELLIKPPEETGLYLIEPEELEKCWKQKKLLIKLPEKARQFVIKEPEELEKLMKLAG